MTIGIEAQRANSLQKTGVEHYAKQLILHLAEVDRKNNYILYLRTQPEEWFLTLPKNFRVKVIPFPIFWTQLRISWEMLVNPVDLLFIPASACPIIHPKRTVVTIHDLAWQFFPQTFTFFNLLYLKFSTWFAVKTASTIIAVSNSTKVDIVKKYSLPPQKVEVVHHGYEPPSFSASKQKINLPLPENYILFLSTLQPRKNLSNLIDAFLSLKKEVPQLPHKLLVVGRPGWKYKNILSKIQTFPNEVVYLNYVSDTERLLILSKAQLLVVPSFYEGFGMQILEGFACKTPVALSNVSSLPEIAGDAAIYFDPNSVEGIKTAIKKVLLNKTYASLLAEKGHGRLSYFSWEKCALQTLAIFTKV